ELTAAATFGGAETAGEIVETEFEHLPALTRPAVSRENGAGVTGEFGKKLAMLLRNNRQKGIRSSLIENRGLPFDQIREIPAASPWLGHAPIGHAIQRRNRASHWLGMQPIRAVVFERGGIHMFQSGDDENPRTRLRDPAAGIEKHGADFIAALPERFMKQV